MIEIRNLCKSYGNLSVLHDINLKIDKGTVFGLVGRSGAGKSTLLRCINGLETFQSGEILVDGQPISTASDRSAREMRRGIGMVFQNFSLLERLTVYENVALPMKCWGYSSREVKQRVSDLLRVVGIEDKVNAYPAHLSGGQKQRVAIARALTMEPRVLLCDEATSALDPSTADSILALLKDINKKTGITIVVVAHQLSVIRQICSHMAVFEDGHLADVGTTERIFMENSPALQNLRGNAEYTLNGCLENLSVALSGPQLSCAIFSRFARETGVEFLILDMQHLGCGEDTVVHYTLSVPGELLDFCRAWFVDNGIICVAANKKVR